MDRIISQSRKAGRLAGDCLRRWGYQSAAALHLPGFLKRYWDSRAQDIDHVWGRAQDDYAVLRRIIEEIAPRRVLDIGCGSGRLFPLYLQFQLEEIVGQDISSKALDLARRRFSSPSISLTDLPLLQLDYSAGHFDLVISNRVLQHIPDNQIQHITAKLAKLGKSIYLNETMISDPARETFYLFKHDYRQLLARCGLAVVRQGMVGGQHWFLFGRESNPM